MALLTYQRGAALIAFALTGACTMFLGVDDFRPGDCAEDCGVSASPASDGGANDGDAFVPASDGGGLEDADGGCEDVSVKLIGGTSRIGSEPAAFDVAAGESQTLCIRKGTQLRLRLDNGEAEWAGVSCERGQGPIDRCEFVVKGPVSITATAK